MKNYHYRTSSTLLTWNAKEWLMTFSFAAQNGYRELRKRVWENTYSIVEDGGYMLPDGKTILLDKTDPLKASSKFYHRPFTPAFEVLSTTPEITVVSDDCLDVAHQWVTRGMDVSLLNMASRQNPGGGVRNGAGAQEEYLFRCSNYYRFLYRYASYAQEYGLKKSHYQYPLDRNYGGIYTPSVTIFRGNEKSGYPLLEKPWQVNIIAVAGMNSPRIVYENGCERIAPELVDGVKNKIRTILRIACDHGQRNLVLGALGCGAFHNPPGHVAELFRDVLCESEFSGAFKKICFAVKANHNSHGTSNYNAFRSVLDGFSTTVYPRIDHKMPALVYKGKMKDGPTWFEVYDDYSVQIYGRGSLIFNLRDFRFDRKTWKPLYQVFVSGEFEEVGDSAFLDWFNLKSVELPRSIKRIRNRAFSDCDNLQVIKMPGNIDVPEAGAFGYSGLKEVIFYDDCPVSKDLERYFCSLRIQMIWRGHKI